MTSWFVKADVDKGVKAPLPGEIPAAPTADLADAAPAIDRNLSIKVSIHRSLLDRINLAALDQLPRAQIETEIRDIIHEILKERKETLNAHEREELVIEVLDELLGLGPLEPLL